MAGGGVGEAMLLSAMMGAGTSMATGRDPMKGALLGAAMGGIGGGLAGGLGGGATAAGSGAALSAEPLGLAASTLGSEAAGVAGAASAAPAGGIAGLPTAQVTPLATPTVQATDLMSAGAQTAQSAVSPFANPVSIPQYPTLTAPGADAAVASTQGIHPPTIKPELTADAVPSPASTPTALGPGDEGAAMPPLSQNSGPTGANVDLGKAVTAAQKASENGSGMFGNLSKNWDKLSPFEKNIVKYGGGIGALMLMQSMSKKDMPMAKPYDGPLSRYAFNPATFRATRPYAAGGPTGGIASLGGFSDGGRMLKGPGDGMSDSIPAMIGDKQPARLADGEFVIPADVVSHLGNGSTDAGARQLYKMMDKVRHARTGNKKQGKQINPDKFLRT